MGDKTFLEKLNRLEEISNLLEAGECSLENAMTLYEEGKKLAEECTKTLNEAKQKIEVESND